MRSLVIVVVSWLVVCVVAAPAEDLIVDLPGAAAPFAFNQYSGYLEASPERYHHYWFVESQNDPATDPVILWLNGGPGCSSLLGFLTELGPFYIDQDGTGELHENPYSWNMIANVIFMESPACVGFSYDTNNNCTSDDDSTSLDNYLAVQDFYRKFPEYQSNDFFITGESYAGMYIPTLTERIVDGQDSFPINLKGFAIGNGFFDRKSNFNSLMFYVYYHGVIGDGLWYNMTQNCCVDGIPSQTNCNFHQTQDTLCDLYVGEAYLAAYGNGLNPYNLISDCGGAESSQRLQTDLKYIFQRDIPQYARPVPSAALTDSYDPACSDNSIEVAYLNDPSVREALHIPSAVQDWSPCSSIEYHELYPSVMDKIIHVMETTRGLIFNGDVDMVCNFLGNEWSVEDLSLPIVEDRRKWESDGQVAGYVKRFENLDFLTIKGAGHMVPGYEPKASLHMIQSFMFQQDY